MTYDENKELIDRCEYAVRRSGEVVPKVLTPDERWEQVIDHYDRSLSNRAISAALAAIDDYFEHRPMHLEFALGPEQVKRLYAWQGDRKVHKKCHSTKTDIVGAFSYTFAPTSVGTVVKAFCSVCKNEVDLSDYDNW